MPEQHTPGPWSLRSWPYDDGTPYHIIQGGNPFGETYAGFRIANILSVADARLISAAPDMKAALTELVDLAGEASSPYIAGSGSDHAWRARLTKAITAAQAALTSGERTP